MAELNRSRDDIVAEMLAELQGAIPDVYIGEDGNIYILFQIAAGQFENAFLANQLLLNDMFVQTASLQALVQHGSQYGIFMAEGVRALGTLQFDGGEGTYIPIFTEASYDPGSGLDPLYFRTIIDGTIPVTGTPAAPVGAVGAATGLTGTYEYAVTYVTAGGETLPSAISNAVTVANQKVNLTAIPLGAAAVTARRIYRDKGGTGVYRFVDVIANNTGTTYTDAIADATVAVAALMPTTDTAHRISLASEAVETGAEGNVALGTITELSDAPATLTGVINLAAFTGGTDDETAEHYRQKVLTYLRNAQSGSPEDIKGWAEAVPGVESATVFQNDNLGVATNGHITVRISATGGAQPTQALLDAVNAELTAQNIANITIHVAGFTAVTTAVTVDVTTEGTYALSDVTPSVTDAITAYINSLETGETLVVSGIIAAVKPLAGVFDVVMVTPTTNQATAAGAKRVPGVITVT